MTECTLFVICGPPGVGKSTVAREIVDRRAARWLRTDEIRDDVVDSPSYTPEERRQVYDAMFERTRSALDEDQSVVLDGTFQYRDLRERASDVADERGVPITFVRVVCTPDAIRDRIADRDGPSDAEFGDYQMIRDNFEKIERDHFVIENSGSRAKTRDQLADALDDTGAG